MSHPSTQLLATLLLLLLLLSVPTAEAHANAAPPDFLRFRLEYEIPLPGDIIGAQFQGCADERCSEITYALTYGRCGAEGCIEAGSSVPMIVDRLDCSLSACTANFRDEMYQLRGQYERLVIHFSDRVRVSQPFDGTWAERRLVVVREEALEMSNEPGVMVVGSLLLFLPAAFLTLLVELLVGYLYLRRFPEIPKKMLLWLLPLHLVTLPMIWFFFPSLRLLPNPSATLLAPAAFSLTLIVGAALLSLSGGYIGERSFMLLFGLGLLSAPFIAWGYATLAAPSEIHGVPAALTTPLSELFAVLFEAWFLRVVNREFLSRNHALRLSLLANAASYALGLLLNYGWLNS
ncbi:MAG: hypothetical protein H0T73_10610 [Ardenticatenales bacterium]|nr:hypothetical protein [Ardenticatenales bacterium]